ncbi:RxLR effector protein [Phytophthora megakarya]|uniref:RxLR effector protein n=1 Tax=Phytophthora megakarya TaxID=4795 RepID=A0A225VIS5_9STRA|nr:RxLR effector protein [Phytophthora megakarya]
MARNSYERLKGFYPLRNTGVADEVAATTKLEGGPATKWKQALSKVKVVNALGKKADEISGAEKKVEVAVHKIQEGVKLNPLDDANPQWKRTVSNLKRSEQLKNVDETQVVKITESVAAEMTKKSSSWSNIHEALLLVYGAALTAMIDQSKIRLIY